ncbi:DUF2079 domain-containing protein [Microtetraspora sp. NBRC 16547]|uniref:DUF2079 domain-containing protein n=1 Tax=Microtetraspora sp. NBRC 16547 TaxID=3030993 RepID=UPI0024A48BFB|nr:DUF2079 domain-containing protein [Microtetraspora sp. NBRC 16547]GLW97963.1 hypothetical protein Misp02_20500 [Microtetraspora sp. NBRC 16547]
MKITLPWGTAGRRARPNRAALILGAITVAAAALYSAAGLIRLHAFRLGTYDLVIFDQAIRSYSRFTLPVSIAKGVHNDFGAGFSVLGDHWSPILVTLAPFYWLHDGPETLLILQGVLLAAAIPPLWLFVRRRLGTAAAHLIAGAYALSWPIAEAVVFDFHEVAFAPALTAWMIERHDAGRTRQAVLAGALLLCVKEDMGLIITGYGLFLVAVRRWRPGLLLAGAGLAAVMVTTRMLIPAFGGRADYYWAYGALGPDLRTAAVRALTHPVEALALLGTPPEKAATVALLGAMVLFLCLLSPMTLIAVPPLAARMLASSFPNWWGTEYHYNAFVVVVLFCAAADGIARTRLASRKVSLAAALLLVAVALVPFFAYGRLLTPGNRARAAADAAAAVPDGVLVEAANYVGPALTSRTRVLLWDRRPRWAPWVVADTGRKTFPFTGLDEQRARVDLLRRSGYQVVFERDGYVVLRAARNDRLPDLG